MFQDTFNSAWPHDYLVAWLSHNCSSWLQFAPLKFRRIKCGATCGLAGCKPRTVLRAHYPENMGCCDFFNIFFLFFCLKSVGKWKWKCLSKWISVWNDLSNAVVLVFLTALTSWTESTCLRTCSFYQHGKWHVLQCLEQQTIFVKKCFCIILTCFSVNFCILNKMRMKMSTEIQIKLTTKHFLAKISCCCKHCNTCWIFCNGKNMF